MAPSGLAPLIHAHFRFQANRVPRNVALRYGQRSETFAELHESSEKLAKVLAARGISAGSYVGVHLERSGDYLTCILGILKANAAVVPLPPSYPAERLKDILKFAGLDLVIDSRTNPIDPSVGFDARSLEELMAEDAPAITFEAGTPAQAAFVLCSSGSTGTPKMIVRSHESFFHRFEWAWREHPFVEGDVGCQKAHMTTTHCLYELFEPLLSGAPVVLIGDEQARNLEEFWRTVRTEGVTRMLLVPSVFRASLEMPEFSPPPLRVLVFMGEYLPAELAAKALSAFPAETSIYSIYGSTEASSTLVCDIRRNYRADGDLPLGQPLSNDIEALVRAPDGASVPAGERGRLYIAGRALFTEYFRDPERTASAFRSLPDWEGKVYDTRDDVRRLPSGELLFVSRTDDTVKVRGFRVDLPEVERAIRTHGGVRDAAVIVTEDAGGISRLVGFYSPAAIAASEIFERLRARLPDYMVPSSLVGVDEFPRTASAKIDRSRLLALAGTGMGSEVRDRTFSDIELRVAASWASILGHEQFGPKTSFFEAGGTSLSSFSLVHRLRAEFDLQREQLEEQSLYQYPTLESLSHYIESIISGRQVSIAALTPALVTLRQASSSVQEPVFLIASAGGTLGAYSKLVQALETDREIIGIRDPFLWDERDPTAGFNSWVETYLNVLRERQPRGPYFIVAYSSAGAFGYEAAMRLRESGEDVALLALIDPLGINSGGRSHFGWWVLKAMTARTPVRLATRVVGSLRGPMLRTFHRWRGKDVATEWGITNEQFEEHLQQTRCDKGFSRFLSSLFELNTGLPLSLTDEDFADVGAGDFLEVFKKHVGSILPEFDVDQLDRIAFQYHLQVRAQHAYRLRRYDGRTLVVEPSTQYAGLVGVQLRPYVKNLSSVVLPLGDPSERVSQVASTFSAWKLHFRSMRDDRFVGELAQVLSREISG